MANRRTAGSMVLVALLGALGSPACMTVPAGDDPASLREAGPGAPDASFPDFVSEDAGKAEGTAVPAATEAPAEAVAGAEEDAENAADAKEATPSAMATDRPDLLSPDLTSPDSGNDAGTASPSIGSFALYATESIQINASALVTGCNVGVENTTGPFLNGGVAAYFNSNGQIQSSRTLYASSVFLNSGASLGPIDTNHLTAQGTTTHGAVSSFPAMPAAPVPPAATAGTTAITLNSGTRTLAPGAYGAVTLNAGTGLFLTGGSYVFSSLTLNSNATLSVSAATTVSVTGGSSFNAGCFVGPAAGSGLTAKALVLYFNSSSPISLNSNAQIQALFVATNATVTVNTSKFTGALVAAEVSLNSGAVITCQDGLGSLGGGCSGSCDDGNPCTADACSGGACTHSAVTNGTACNDGNACTQTDTCQSGSCTGSNPVTCTAADQCHVAGTCSPATGQCSNPAAANGTTCSDGNACTQTDTCQSGSCTGSNPVTCAAADQCHVAGTCSPATGQCSNPAAANGTTCSDGNACTQLDSCVAGVCAGASPVVCAAADQCHAAGMCNSATGVCSNPALADGTGCSDGNPCTQSDQCTAGACVGSNPVTCTASDQCHAAGTCDPTTGTCSNPSANDGTACNDGNACTQTDVCMAGACTGANPVTCAPGDACHLAGTCDPTSGQCSTVAAADGTSCSDGNQCVFAGSESCLAGACTGTPSCGGTECLLTQCSGGQCAPAIAGTPCSTGACDGNGHCGTGNPATGVTYQAPVCPPPTGACSTGPGVFDALVRGCYYLPAPAGTACPTGVCDGDNNCVAAGGVVDGGESYVSVLTAACPIATACVNPGSIDFAAGACAYVDLAAGTACGAGTCDVNGNCSTNDAGGADAAADAAADAGPSPCDDSDPCTVDVLNGDGSCAHYLFPDGTTCNDGNVCNQAEACKVGVCVGTTPAPAGKTCPSGTCDGNGSCTAGSSSSSGGSGSGSGGSGSSSGGSGSGGSGSGSSGGSGGVTCAPGQCDDANPCTADTCNADGTCGHAATANGTACSDGNACTQGEVCQAGACGGGTAITCAAPDACHAASCNAATGCVYAALPVGTTCGTTANVCGGQLACDATGACIQGALAPVGTACATNADLCAGAYDCDGNGNCVQGAPPVIDTSNPCMVGSCDPTKGVTYTPSPGTACGDNSNLCARTFVCNAAGTCDTIPPPAVSPPNRCVTGTCDPATGAVSYAPIAGCDPNPTTGGAFETQASLIGQAVMAGTGAPASGFTVTAYDDTTATPRTDASVTIASDGSFRVRLTSFPTSEPDRSPPHHILISIDSPSFLSSYRSAYVHPGTAFNFGPIHVVPRDPNVTMIDASGGTATDSQGLVQVIVPPGALTSPTPIRITPFQSRADLPYPLPNLTVPGYAMTFEPDGTQFQVPVTVRMKNWRNLPTSVTIPVGLVDLKTGLWSHWTSATWDGAMFAFPAAHFTTVDANLAAEGHIVIATSHGRNLNDSATACLGSTLGVANGTLRQSFDLPGVQRRGTTYAVGLNYDSRLTFGTDETATPPTTTNGSVPTTSVVATTSGVTISATCVPGPAPAGGGGCGGGGGCIPGALVSIPAGLQMNTNGPTSNGPAVVVDTSGNSLQFNTDIPVPLPVNTDGTMGGSGYAENSLAISQSAGGSICVASGGAFGEPAGGSSRASGVSATLGETTPVATVEMPTFVYHRHTSPYGIGWGIGSVGHVYQDPAGSEAVIVSGEGNVEYFYSHVNVTPLGNTNGGAAAFSHAIDPTTGQVFRVSQTTNAIDQVNPVNGTATTLVSGLGLPMDVLTMSIGYVGGVRHFLLTTNTALIDVDNSGNQRTIYVRRNLNAGTGSSLLWYMPGVAVLGHYAYYTTGFTENNVNSVDDDQEPALLRFDLTQPTPAAVALSLGTGGDESMNPSVPLSAYEFGDIHGMAPAPDGGLYVADRGRNIIFELKPDANGEVAGDSLIVPVVGDGNDQSLSPVGIWQHASGFSLAQPGALAVGPDGVLWILTPYGAATYDPLRTEARWKLFDNNVANSENNFGIYASYYRASFAPVASDALIGTINNAIYRLDIAPFVSELDPTRTLSFVNSAATLTDTTRDLVEAYDTSGRLVERQTREGDPIDAVTYVGTTDTIAQILDPTGGASTFAYKDGVLLSITDAANRPTTFVIDGNSDLKSYTTPDGETWTFDYTDHRMTLKTSPEKDQTHYFYGSDGSLSSVTKPAGEQTTNIQPGYYQPPGHDAAGYPLYTASYTDTHGVTHTMTLDAFGRTLVDQYTADGVSYVVQHDRQTWLGQSTSPDPIAYRSNRLIGREYRVTTNGLGAGLDNLYDSLGRWVADLDNNTLANGYEDIAYYDPNGRVAGFRNGAGTDSFAIARDPNGRPLSVTASNGRTVGFSWRGDGLLATSTEHGVTTTYSYNDPVTFNVTSTVDTVGRTTAFGYDPAGNVISASDPATTWTFLHDGNNRLVSATDQENNTTTFSYVQRSCGCSEANLLTSLHTPDLAAALAWTFDYGPEGRLSTLTDPDGHAESYAYQPSGELTGLTDRNNHVTTKGYDQLGRVTSVVDAIGRAHSRAYATPVASAWSGQDIVSGSASSTNASTDFTQALNNGDYQLGTNVYDTFTSGADGFPIGPSTHHWPSVELYRDATFQLSYGRTLDNFGRATNTQDRPSSQLTSSAILPSGSGANHWDPLIYSTATTAPLVTTAGQSTGYGDQYGYNTEYDLTGSNGDYTNIYDNKSRTTINRDVAGRVTLISTIYGDGLPFGGGELTLNQPTVYVPSGVDAGRIQSNPQGIYTYDDRGLVETRTVAAGVYTYEYDALGRNSRLTYPDGHTRTQIYDNEGRLSSRCYAYAGLPTPNCYTAVYDGVGNPTQLSDPAGTDVITYDALDRVSTVTRAVTGDVETYAYNSLGALSHNATVAMDHQRPLLANPAVKGDSAIPASLGGAAVTVDGEGKITSLAGTAITYKPQGMVSSVAGLGMYWNEFGQLVADQSTQEIYTYDGVNRSAAWSYDTTQTPAKWVKKDFWLYDGVDHPLEHDDASGNRQYYEVDLAGNVRRLMGAGGVDLGGYRYTAFGEAYAGDHAFRAPQGVNALPVRWKGRWLAYSGNGVELYDMRARWWCPQTGTFVSVDGFQHARESNTLWAWPNQNPLRFSDFTGHDATTDNPVQWLLNNGWLPPGLAMFGMGVRQRANGISELANDATFEQGMRDINCGSNAIAASAAIIGADTAVIQGMADLAVGAARQGVEWNNGWRTADGKFASELGAQAPGKDAEASFAEAALANGFSILGEQVSILGGDNYTVADFVLQNTETGEISAVEIKSGEATLNANQADVHAAINSTGGFPFGANAANVPAMIRNIVTVWWNP